MNSKMSRCVVKCSHYKWPFSSWLLFLSRERRAAAGDLLWDDVLAHRRGNRLLTAGTRTCQDSYGLPHTTYRPGIQERATVQVSTYCHQRRIQGSLHGIYNSTMV